VRRGWIRRPFQVVVIMALATAITWQRHNLIDGAHRLKETCPGWFAVALGAEVASVWALVELQRTLLAAGGLRLGRARLLGMAYASGSISATLPAGDVAGTGYTYRQLARSGAPSGLATWLLVATGVVSAAALVIIGLLGAAVRGIWPGSPVGVLLAGTVAGGVAAVLVGLARISACPSRLDAMARRTSVLVGRGRRLLRLLPGPEPGPRLPGAPRPRESLTVRPRRWVGAFTLAGLNWLADCTALGVTFLALGVAVPWRGLLWAYAASQVVNSLPWLPGSIGLAEGSMSLALVCAGARPGDAIGAVLVYRVVSFWIPLPIGGLAWRALRRRSPAAVAVTSPVSEPVLTT
jgi:uncharacterized membrane protein YbhN (UPF0104 family)